MTEDAILKYSSRGMDAILSNMGMDNSNLSLENEIYMIRSSWLMAQVVDDDAARLHQRVYLLSHLAGRHYGHVAAEQHRQDLLADDTLTQSAGTNQQQSPTLVVAEPVGYLVVVRQPLCLIAQEVLQSLLQAFFRVCDGNVAIG